MGNREKSIIPIGGIVGLIMLIVLIFLGNIIIIGDKIANVNLYLSYLYYGVVVVLFLWLIVFPIFRVLITPHLNGFRNGDITYMTPMETSEYILNLRKRIRLTRDEDRELRLGNNRKETIKRILNRCNDEMEGVIKDSAVSSFVVTAISQNGSLDFISSMVINFKMINNIIRILGNRPSYIQLFKLYISVFSASLVVTALDDVLGDIDYGELLGGGIGIIGGQALNVIVPSATNGLMNAFITLRVGYATKKYLEDGNKLFDKKEARKYAIKSARQHILSIVKVGVVEIGRKAKNIVSTENV